MPPRAATSQSAAAGELAGSDQSSHVQLRETLDQIRSSGSSTIPPAPTAIAQLPPSSSASLLSPHSIPLSRLKVASPQPPSTTTSSAQSQEHSQPPQYPPEKGTLRHSPPPRTASPLSSTPTKHHQLSPPPATVLSSPEDTPHHSHPAPAAAVHGDESRSDSSVSAADAGGGARGARRDPRSDPSYDPLRKADGGPASHAMQSMLSPFMAAPSSSSRSNAAPDSGDPVAHSAHPPAAASCDPSRPGSRPTTVGTPDPTAHTPTSPALWGTGVSDTTPHVSPDPAAHASSHGHSRSSPELGAAASPPPDAAAPLGAGHTVSSHGFSADDNLSQRDRPGRGADGGGSEGGVHQSQADGEVPRGGGSLFAAPPSSLQRRSADPTSHQQQQQRQQQWRRGRSTAGSSVSWAAMDSTGTAASLDATPRPVISSNNDTNNELQPPEARADNPKKHQRLTVTVLQLSGSATVRKTSPPPHPPSAPGCFAGTAAPRSSSPRTAPHEPLSSSGEEGEGERAWVVTRGGSSAAESEGDALQPQEYGSMYESAGTYDEDDDDENADLSNQILDSADPSRASPGSRPPLRSRSTMIRHLEGHLAARRGRQAPARPHPCTHTAPPRHPALLTAGSSHPHTALSSAIPVGQRLQDAGSSATGGGSVGSGFHSGGGGAGGASTFEPGAGSLADSLRLVSLRGKGVGGSWPALTCERTVQQWSEGAPESRGEAHCGGAGVAGAEGRLVGARSGDEAVE
ncbi:MAG: hypothetical protein WDW36_006850 [Sanguina aurantia]